VGFVCSESGQKCGFLSRHPSCVIRKGVAKMPANVRKFIEDYIQFSEADNGDKKPDDKDKKSTADAEDKEFVADTSDEKIGVRLAKEIVDYAKDKDQAAKVLQIVRGAVFNSYKEKK